VITSHDLQDVLICSFAYGKMYSAEGACTQRLVHALADAGLRVTLVTSHYSDAEEPRDNLSIVRVSAWPCRPSRLVGIAESLCNRNLSHVFWRRRISRLQYLPKCDLVYSRSNPLSSLIAGAELAQRMGIPFLAHFSDPMPGPHAYDKKERSRILNAIRPGVMQARAITFTTHETLEYQSHLFDSDIRPKSHVLNHVSPEPTVWGPYTERKSVTVLYAGTFVWPRTPDSLLEGFELYLKTDPRATLKFLGTQPASVLARIRSARTRDSVEFIPRSSDMEPFLKNAHLLVAVDTNVEAPQFLPSKLVDYLLVDRNVLLITQDGSPGMQLLNRFADTTASVLHDPVAIAREMKRLVDLEYQRDRYTSRFTDMADFSAHSIVETFRRIASAQCRPVN
jgi:glycosyltransferase involved in cell wall biosynthesis